MIKNLLDLDLYKITVQQIIFHRFSNVTSEYAFTCRNNSDVKLASYIPLERLRSEIFNLENVSLGSLYPYISQLDFVTPEYAEFLRMYKLNPRKYVTVDIDPNDNTNFLIRSKGPWLFTILFETLVLSIVNELYSHYYIQKHNLSTNDLEQEGYSRISKKIQLLTEYNKNSTEHLKLIEFGTRRRFSNSWQDNIIKLLKENCPTNLVGTSNVYFAHKHNLHPIGTFGHEFVMGMQGLYPFQHAQREAFKVWLREYRGTWGIALTDTYNDKTFLKDFSYELAKGFDGVRHDSGDPYDYGNMIINMYKNFNINPKDKRIVFSDGLDIPTAIDLHKAFHDKIKVSFGIGTNLTNDMGYFKVPQIVMKLVKSHDQHVVKLSNNPAKINCECPVTANYVLNLLG